MSMLDGIRPRRRPLIIAGTASGVGKTTIATGLMGALGRRGYKVAPFKVGPDYIDPGFHTAVTGTPSRNLDTWLTSPQAVKDNYRRGSAGADICVVEGVMGLFDGRAGASGGVDEGSTAEMARLLDGTVVLVVDCARMARSLAPLLEGFAGFDSRVRLGGAILNNVGSSSHASSLEAAAAEAGVPVMGTLTRRDSVSLPSRHLGLVPAAEMSMHGDRLEAITTHVEESLNVDGLVALAAAGQDQTVAGGLEAHGRDPAQANIRLAVARDEPFSFYYQDSLEALERAGAELIFFSPLRDRQLPDCDGIYLGGGFPEVFAAGLEANYSMRSSIADAASRGLPVYAECGGLVYLCNSVEVDGKSYQMVGAIPASASMTATRQALGYVEARALGDNILTDRGGSIRGHEFHWSTVSWPRDTGAYECYSLRHDRGAVQGFAAGNMLASFVHINFAGNPGAAERFVAACATNGEVGTVVAGS